MWIDSHCHLNHAKLAEAGTPEQVVENARAGGVESMLTICCRVADEFPEVLATAKKFPNVWCTIGTHPHDASKPGELALTQDQLVEKSLSDPKIVGIGETGLDYFYKNSTPEDQHVSFRKHIRACIEADMPMVVHARDADEDIAKIIKEENKSGKLRGVMHCFSSGRKLAEEALDFGFYISFSGILTFKQAEDLRAIARDVPKDRLLVETDSPYLAPMPHRGKTNQPAYVAHTGAVLAEIHGVSPEEMARITKQNFFSLFKRAA
jgi:TatD DNase family protein